jgi:hypothetical protein
MGEIRTEITIHIAAFFPFRSATVPTAIERASQISSQIKASIEAAGVYLGSRIDR